MKLLLAFAGFFGFLVLQRCASLSIRGNQVEPTLVRCPHGWLSRGPLCVTVFHAAPYTQCPTNISKFRAKDPPRGGMWVVDVGVCGFLDVLSPNITCPNSSNLPDFDEIDENNHKHYVPRCMGPNSTESAAVSYKWANDDVPLEISSNDVENKFDINCPEGFEVELSAYNGYAFRNRQFVRCIRKMRVKGKLWCPENFTAFGMHVILESVALDQQPSEAAKQPHENDLFLKAMPDWLEGLLKAPSGCAQVIAVHYKACSEFACNTPYVNQMRSVLKHWSNKKVGIIDEDVVLSWGMPSGNDLRWPSEWASIPPPKKPEDDEEDGGNGGVDPGHKEEDRHYT